MRHLKTRKGGRVTFGRTEWVVYAVGSKEPCAAGCDLYADKYYEEETEMPLWTSRDGGKAEAWARRVVDFSPCGVLFRAATAEEAQALVNDHEGSCDACKAAYE